MREPAPYHPQPQVPGIQNTGQPHLPAGVQHAGPVTTLHAGQDVGEHWPEPVPLEEPDEPPRRPPLLLPVLLEPPEPMG